MSQQIQSASRSSPYPKSASLNPHTNSHPQAGQLLLEVLIAIAAAAVVVSVGSELVVVSLRGNKTVGERNVAVGLVQETLEAARSVAAEKWQNVYSLTAGSTNHYPQQSSGKWVATIGTETVTINGLGYQRAFTVQNVCRSSGGAITGITDTNGGGPGSTTTCTISGGSDDPSTQRITATVTWGGGDSIAVSEYVTRWRNQTCNETKWTTPGSGSSVITCGSEPFDTSTTIDYTSVPGSLKISS